MTFAQTIDPRWHHRRRSGSRRIGKRGVHPSYVYHNHHAHANVARALPLSDGIAMFSHPTAGVVAEEKQRPSRIDKRGVVPPLSLRRVDRGTLGRLDDLKVGRSSSGRSSSSITNNSSHADISGVAGQPRDGGGSDWSRKGLLGCGARVLALSMYSKKRELLCDRKDPYLHLTPRRLAFTVVKSGFVVAAPMVNQVILENLDEDDDRPPPRRPNEGGASGGGGGMSAYSALGGLGAGNLGVYYNTEGRLVFDREEANEDAGNEGGRDDLMKSLSKSFELFPALTFRRVLHSVMTVSTQRILEWQAVMHLSARTADRLTKNIALSALRKTKRMSRGMAAAKMTLTAGKSLFFQNLALFIVDELFLAVRLGLRERSRRKQNPYSCTDWAAVLREMREKSLCNASFAFCIWVAGTLGAVAGTIVYPARGPELLSILAEMGASALLT